MTGTALRLGRRRGMWMRGMAGSRVTRHQHRASGTPSYICACQGLGMVKPSRGMWFGSIHNIRRQAGAVVVGRAGVSRVFGDGIASAPA